MERRQFIAKAGLIMAAGTLVSGDIRCLSRTEQDAETPSGHSSFAVQAPTWTWVRQQFDLSLEKIHLGALLMASHPRPVREAIERFRRRLNEDPVSYLEQENSRLQEDVRREAAAYLGADHDEIALTDSTTMGIGIVYNGLRLRPPQEIVTTEHDYYATHEALRLAAARTGVSVRKIALHEQPQAASADEIVARIRRALTPTTRVLALTWVHSSTGLKLPLGAIAEAVASVNARRDEADQVLVCVDGVHGFGVEDVCVGDLGCDFLMAGCHKWLFGPRGTGIIYGRRPAWAALHPIIPSFMDDASWHAWGANTQPEGPTTAVRMSPGGFKPFEHQWATAEAFRFHQQIGKARIAERTHGLCQQLKKELARMAHVTLYTPSADSLSAGIVCFDVDGLSAEVVVERLRRRHIIATTTPYATSYARLTPSIYNTPEEIETTLREIRAMGVSTGRPAQDHLGRRHAIAH